MVAALPTSLLAAFPLAFAAGVVSFISPCVLPLLPGYLAFLSGATGQAGGRSGRGRAVVGSLAFVFGFAIVFVSFGALFGGLGSSLRTHQRGLEVVFGVITVLLGLFLLVGGRRAGSNETAASITCRALPSSARHCSGLPLPWVGHRASGPPWPRYWDSPRRHPELPRFGVQCSPLSTVWDWDFHSCVQLWRPSGWQARLGGFVDTKK